MNSINWDDFEKVRMHVGVVVEAEQFLIARNPSYWLTIDFGPEIGIKRTSAAIAPYYSLTELQGKQVVAVTNFPPKQIANRLSEVLVLAGVNADGSMRLLEPDAEVDRGARVW
jgi:tRNA-binding protein